MRSPPPSLPPLTHSEELRGAVKLVVQATVQVTEVVQEMHIAIGGGPELLGRPLARVVRALTAPTYASIKGITRVVGGGLDLALKQLGPTLGESKPGPEREALLGALNGVIGDHLAETGSALAIPMQLRQAGAALADPIPNPRERLLLFIHGSSASDGCWTRRGPHLGASLAEALDATLLDLRYNSGLHISINGAQLSALLEEACAAWPVPLREIIVVAHSMGGLVMRAACHSAEDAGHAWRGHLRSIFFLGTPHHGAPLERYGNTFETALGWTTASAPLARLGRLRSAGVTDLRFGNVLEPHWQGRDRFERHPDPRQILELPVGVDCYAVAATTAPTVSPSPPSDGMVPVASALGHHTNPALCLDFPPQRQAVLTGRSHLDLLDVSEVAQQLRAWLNLTTG